MLVVGSYLDWFKLYEMYPIMYNHYNLNYFMSGCEQIKTLNSLLLCVVKDLRITSGDTSEFEFC